MERRRLGRTGMLVSVLGFGGSEIGYQRASGRTVARLLGGALDAGLNVIDTAECYENSEELIGKAVGGRRNDFYLFTKCGHAGSFGNADWRPASLLKSLERARERGWARFIGYSGDGDAARYAIECGRFDTLQTSVSIADQEVFTLTLPLARKRGLGVIAKRPIANVAWRYGRKPAEPYYQDYWTRLRTLDYPFLRGAAGSAVSTALRFTLGAPGVHTAIVGTTKPERWKENAALLDAGPLPSDETERIRARWREVADASWTGQV